MPAPYKVRPAIDAFMKSAGAGDELSFAWRFWDMQAKKQQTDISVAGALDFVSTDYLAMPGGYTEATVIANGTNIPTFDGATHPNWNNTNGHRNLVRLMRVGLSKFWVIIPDVGAAGNFAPYWGAAPSIDVPAVGTPLTVSTSHTVYGTPTIVLTYQWKLNGANIVGATTDTYTPVGGDIGGALSVTVTATNSAGAASATSNVQVVPSNVVAPTVTVAAAINQAVAGSASTASATFTGVPTPTKSYQWNLDGSPIGGATAQTYTPVTGDLGHALSVTVTGTNTGGSASTTSGATTVTSGAGAPTYRQPGGIFTYLRSIGGKYLRP